MQKRDIIKLYMKIRYYLFIILRKMIAISVLDQTQQLFLKRSNHDYHFLQLCNYIDESIYQLIYQCYNSNVMKTAYLNNFQKQQYTKYLETQLQKFSAFMLQQKKENDRCNHLEAAIQQQGLEINRLASRLNLVELYQQENLKNKQILFRQHEELGNLEPRIRKIEHIFFKDGQMNQQELRRNANKSQRNTVCEPTVKDIQQNMLNQLQNVYEDVLQKIKKLQIETQSNRTMINRFSSIKKNQNLNVFKGLQGKQIEDLVERKDLKKLQKKMQKYFSNKFEEIEQLMRGSMKRRSKSPSTRSPKTTSISRKNEQPLMKQLSHFQIDDHIDKKEFSTISQISRDLISEASNNQLKKMIKSKSKKSKKSREAKRRKRSKSISDNSILKSSISHSRSPINTSISRISKKSKHESRDRSISRSKISELSCCKSKKPCRCNGQMRVKNAKDKRRSKSPKMNTNRAK